MQGDNYVRFLLTLVAVALIVLVVQGFDRGGVARGGEAGEISRGRYALNMLRTRRGQTLLKLDSHTGQVWRTNPDHNEPWVEVGVAGDAPPQPEGAAVRPAPGAPSGPGVGTREAPDPQ